VLFAGLFGGKAFLDVTNRIQPGVGLTLLAQVLVPKLKTVMQNKIECKIQVVGLSRLLCDTPALLQDNNGQQIWAQTFKGVVGILTFVQYQVERNSCLVFVVWCFVTQWW
jgi:exportin-2 (importin alpha re-exporter)